MARCKCKWDKMPLDTKEAFKIVEDGKNVYFCNEECYKKYTNEKEIKEKEAADKNRAYGIMCDILDQQQIITSALWKEYNVWRKVATSKQIADYLEENRDFLRQSVSRVNGPLYNKIRYMSAIVCNKIADYVEKAKVREKNKMTTTRSTSSFELFEPVVVKEQREEHILYDVEDDLI